MFSFTFYWSIRLLVMNTHQILKPKLIYGTPSGSRKSPKKWSQSVLLASLNFGMFLESIWSCTWSRIFWGKKLCPKISKMGQKSVFWVYWNICLLISYEFYNESLYYFCKNPVYFWKILFLIYGVSQPITLQGS